MLKSGTMWTFSGNEAEREAFGSLASSLALFEQETECVSSDPISAVKRLKIADTTYYVKYYRRNGKWVRKYFGRGRLQGEWENLLYFAALGIPIPRLVGYGHHYHRGKFQRGALVTAEVPHANDLLTLSRRQPQLFKERNWLLPILRQTADYTGRLHQHGFIHWDLKWRNILISDDCQSSPQVYFFDCPLGRERRGWLRRRGEIKDLACLDKVGKKVLSRSQRLTFFKCYRQRQTTEHLTADDKRLIRQIVKFFAA